MALWHFLVVLMALTAWKVSAGSGRLCGDALTEALKDACGDRGYNGHENDCYDTTAGPTRERRSTTQGIVDECCHNECTNETLMSYCRQPCHQADINTNQLTVDDSVQMDPPVVTSAPQSVATPHSNVLEIENDASKNQDDSSDDFGVGTLEPMDLRQLIHLDV